MKKAFAVALMVAGIALQSAHAQAPSGTIAGVVKDPVGALVLGAQVTILHLGSASPI